MIDLLAQLRKQIGDRRRFVLGIAGPPGSGKSTLADDLAEAACEAGLPAAVVPMDGFHLPAAELRRLDLHGRKGAPHTFDLNSYVARLCKLRAGGDVRVPIYDRAIHDVRPNARTIPAATRLVITEGNYLLLADGGWQQVRPMLDACWYLDVPLATCLERVRARHIAGGLSPEAADRKLRENDEPNARCVMATKYRADRIVTG